MAKSELDNVTPRELISIDTLKLFQILDNLDYRLKELEKRFN